MIRLFGLWVVGGALCVTPVAADEGIYDGPTAIRPLTVKPQPPHSVQPNTVCDFEHQCYPERGGPAAAAPAVPPAIVVKPIARRPQVPDEHIVATWRDCMARALQTYEQSHDLHALRMATGSCQARLEAQDGEEYDGEDYGVADGEDYGVAEPPVPLPAAPRTAGRRDIGCGWWPIGSDADQDCATRGRRF
jgi:hypothetical protein